MKTEYILCAAIWIKDGNKYDDQPKNVKEGLVVCGRRHHNCFYTRWVLMGKSIDEIAKDSIQGFITNTDRFVDRSEAAEIAYQAQQIGGKTDILFSEDLY